MDAGNSTSALLDHPHRRGVFRRLAETSPAGRGLPAGTNPADLHVMGRCLGIVPAVLSVTGMVHALPVREEAACRFLHLPLGLGITLGSFSCVEPLDVAIVDGPTLVLGKHPDPKAAATAWQGQRRVSVPASPELA